MRRVRSGRARLAALLALALAAGDAPAAAGQTAPATAPSEAPATAPTEAPMAAPAVAAPATAPTPASITSPGAPAAAAAAGAAPASGPAETLYVIEQLVANVNSTPDASGERIAIVRSGERVEVLERRHDQVHVRLSGGRDGWIRASYLSSAEPLRQRLTQRDAELAQLREQVASLQRELGAAHTAPAAGGSNATAARPARAAAVEDPGEPPPGVLFSTAEEPRRVWPWALGAWLVGLAIGTALGLFALDRHIRRRYGGLRIY